MILVPDFDSVPTIVDAAFLLDDLDLIAGGVPLLEDLDAPVMAAAGSDADQVQVLEPEGVPIAIVECTSNVCTEGRRVTSVRRWLARRPERPFEDHHLDVAHTSVPDCTILLDDRVGPEAITRELGERGAWTALVMLPVALERDGQADQRMVDRARRTQQMLHALPASLRERLQLVMVPISEEHPYRVARIRACTAAYSRGAPVIDLTGDGGTGPLTPGGGAVVFFTGLSGSGKSTLARALRNRLLERTDRGVTLLDGDVVRRHLSAGLGFGAADRDTNIRRIGWVAARIAEHGGLAICSPIAPFEATRRGVQKMALQAGGQFVLIHVATPLAECERRDRKGLYARARRGEIPDFTGISSPYEVPEAPDLRLDTTGRNIEDLTQNILEFGVQRGLWSTGRGS